MKKMLLGICLACCLLAGCTETGAAASSAAEPASIPASSSNVAESSSNVAESSSSAAESSSSVAESVSVPESSSSLVESASTPASSSSIAASVPAPQQAVPPSSTPSEPAQPVEREYIHGRIFDPYTQSDPQDFVSRTNSYWNELRGILSPSDYAFMGRDEVSGVIGICTMTPKKVQSVIAEHPNEFIEVRYFPAECTREQLLTEIERIKKEPMIKKYNDEIHQVSSFNKADEYDVIFISCYLEVIPELEDWVKTLHSPFEVRVTVSQKTLPG